MILSVSTLLDRFLFHTWLPDTWLAVALSVSTLLDRFLFHPGA